MHAGRFDETCLGVLKKRASGRLTETRGVVAVACEQFSPDISRSRSPRIGNALGASLHAFVERAIEAGCEAHTARPEDCAALRFSGYGNKLTILRQYPSTPAESVARAH
jgi:hypothetical protein